MYLHYFFIQFVWAEQHFVFRLILAGFRNILHSTSTNATFYIKACLVQSM